MFNWQGLLVLALVGLVVVGLIVWSNKRSTNEPRAVTPVQPTPDDDAEPRGPGGIRR